MPSTQQSSEPAQFSDEAVQTLLIMAGWRYEFERDYQQWVVWPDSQAIGAAFDTLQDVLEYFLMYRRLNEQT